jgi:hypothetical protein
MTQPEFLPEEAGDDDSLLEQYRNPALKPEAQASFIDELLHIVRQANAPRPLVILEREQADFLRNLMLDLVLAMKRLVMRSIDFASG